MFLIYGGNKNQPVILFTRKYILQKGCEERKKSTVKNTIQIKIQKQVSLF